MVDIDKAEKQAIEYLEALNNEEAADYVAMVTDGIRCQFIELKDGSVRKEAITDFSGASLNRLIKAIIDLSLQSLNAKNLINDLTINNDYDCSLVDKLTQALYGSLKHMNYMTEVEYNLWKGNFGLSHEDASQQIAIEKRKKDLAAIVKEKDIKTDEEYKILFALQTSVAIIAMLIAYKVVSVIKEKNIANSLKTLAELESNSTCIQLGKMATGEMAYDIKIYNLLEIGCFAWPFQDEHWNNQIYDSINKIINVLLKYENQPDLSENTDDLFRDIYMAIMPISVRHSLGEYYTPKWLARKVIQDGLRHLEIDYHKHVRVLDTAAGSGTFPQNIIADKKLHYKSEDSSVALNYILNEVALIDANILAVILARINYFISISDLISEDQEIYIPAYIGDSTVSNQDKVSNDGKYYVQKIECSTGIIEINMPIKALHDRNKFLSVMKDIEAYAQNDKLDDISSKLQEICEYEQDVEGIKQSFLELNKDGNVNPILINSLIDYFLLCSMGKFDLIVGNPPWVDWKNLPSVHREKIKEACISRELFSGDGRTGGINLNVCALLSSISAENWLAPHGVMAVLMPQSILFQQSYEGYRNLKLGNGGKLYFQEIVDWESSGHPFSPVQQLFVTYIMAHKEQDYFRGIPVKSMVLKKGFKLCNISNEITDKTFENYFETVHKVLGRTTDARTAFTFANSISELHDFQMISGKTEYIGREGVEYYPQELQLFTITNIVEKEKIVEVKTYKSSKSKYIIPERNDFQLETKYLRPLVKGIDIKRFGISESRYVVAFPYDEEHYKIPIPGLELRTKSRKLYEYYNVNKTHLSMQNSYSDSIINNAAAEYYALARTGKYSHAPWYVVFRDNTKWVSAVVGKMETEWGGTKIPAFQNHCVSICEDGKGNFISEDEAHYICSIINSHIAERFVLATSDKRTFKIRLPFKILPYDRNNKLHRKLSNISIKAHSCVDDESQIELLRKQIDDLYLKTL